MASEEPVPGALAAEVAQDCVGPVCFGGGCGASGRLARLGVEHLEAGLSARGRGMIVADQGETVDDLVGDMIEVLTSMCARLYGRRGARHRAMGAVTATGQAEVVAGG